MEGTRKERELNEGRLTRLCGGGGGRRGKGKRGWRRIEEGEFFPFSSSLFGRKKKGKEKKRREERRKKRRKWRQGQGQGVKRGGVKGKEKGEKGKKKKIRKSIDVNPRFLDREVSVTLSPPKQ